MVGPSVSNEFQSSNFNVVDTIVCHVLENIGNIPIFIDVIDNVDKMVDMDDMEDVNKVDNVDNVNNMKNINNMDDLDIDNNDTGVNILRKSINFSGLLFSNSRNSTGFLRRNFHNFYNLVLKIKFVIPRH